MFHNTNDIAIVNDSNDNHHHNNTNNDNIRSISNTMLIQVVHVACRLARRSALARIYQRKGKCSQVGSALYAMFSPTKCICAVTARWFDNPHNKKWFLGAGFLGSGQNIALLGFLVCRFLVCNRLPLPLQDHLPFLLN